MSIRQGIDQINKNIKKLEEERLELQDSCKHNSSKEVDYMWRPGAITKVVMCDNCDKILKNVDNHIVTPIYTHSDKCSCSEPDWAGNDVEGAYCLNCYGDA